MAVVEVAADLHVELSGSDGEKARGHLTGRGGQLTFEIDNPSMLAGADDAPAVRAAAEVLAARGISVRVVHEGVHLVTMGAVSAPWWQRRATGSRRIRVGSWRGAWTSLRARAGGQGAVLPHLDSLPPPTLLPLLPTFSRHPRRRVSTTNRAPGSGAPRLVLEKPQMWPDERQPVYWLTGEQTTIGSGASCDIVLPGLAPVHAVVVHDAEDEYLVRSCGPRTSVHGAVVLTEQLLRTGARIDVGPHALSFYREEYADHGRPFAGRVGGELGHQRSQPGRGAPPS